ncbi:MAG TPA: S-layer homology domain-containing protein, partial [Anaerolineales bacterium]|nr:S-layer homology domain-containing protein [Anaerolineales bacterium]
IASGPTGSYPAYMKEFNGKLFFRAYDSAHGYELWSYDGVQAPSLVYDLVPGTNSGGAGSLAVFNNKLYFEAHDSVHGNEAWVYDGVNPPSLAFEIWPGVNSGNPGGFTVFNNILYFSAKNEETFGGYEMMSYDGVNPPTVVVDLWPGSNAGDPYGFTQFNNKLYFSGNDGSGIGYELWAFHDDSVGPTFADVPASYWAYSWIERLYDSGITGGCSANPLSYCPDNPVTRAQMAVFLEKALHGSAFIPPNVAPTFGDTSGHWAEDWIEALKTDGITSGCGAGLYCPEDSVTRAQMAVFLLKAKYGSAYAPPAVGSATGFSDVATDHWAAAWIKQLAAEGITGGCGAGVYCPENPVTRAQMAVFLVKTFSLP